MKSYICTKEECAAKITNLNRTIETGAYTAPQIVWKPLRCRCECIDHGPCEHDFSGPVIYTRRSGSVTCQHCGMDAMSHDMKL
jgi:hypothetical protein